MKKNEASEKDPRNEYIVLIPYQCPQTKFWKQKDDNVLLLPCEAEFLVNNGKIKRATNPSPKGDK